MLPPTSGSACAYHKVEGHLFDSSYTDTIRFAKYLRTGLLVEKKIYWKRSPVKHRKSINESDLVAFNF